MNLKAGDKITLNEKAREWTMGRVFTVDEVKNWGVTCYTIPDEPILGAASVVDDDRVFYRAANDEIETVVARGQTT